ncbi:unknown; predicted coding region [Mycoplasmopsis pulmonis]|uniref:Uncharacterized protein n=1 Tax=Mycoplasmopsis pulmonis (strain UAB CTIP) TaxID=272635 RepID=Q98RC4_MYCPU|nr:NfeD family protein [Mycoplasmopsis pulmonis]MDZ7293058.1 NfeD family protein [Mycoplasmopsis pulmonis]CAC13258.1 unknown; predicted coding region [Mycoplasmopsis pulmonis]
MDTIQIILIVFWSLVILITLVIELLTFGIFSSIITIAAIPSLIIATSGPLEWYWMFLQFVIFIFLFVILYFSFYKAVKKYLAKMTLFKGPIQDIVGTKTKLLISCNETNEDINNYGSVSINGKNYRTLSEVGEGKIEKDNIVEISAIRGTTLFVKKVSQNILS